MLQDFNIKRLPKEVQVNYLTQLSIDELVYFYNVDTGYRNLLNNKFVINQLAEIYDVTMDKPITTFKELITQILWKLTPLEIYDLYMSNESLGEYMNDLRITAKYFVYLMSRNLLLVEDILPTKIDVVYKELNNILERKAVLPTMSGQICKDTLRDKTLRGLIKVIDIAYKVEPKINLDGGYIEIKNAVLNTRCNLNIVIKSTNGIPKFEMLNILEKWGFDPNDYSHLSKGELYKQLNKIALEIYESQNN